MKKKLTSAVALACAVAILTGVQAQAQQTEEEFQKLMPISGKVETYFSDFKIDHSFPAVGEADKIYDRIDHQRASQLYLWGIPLVAMQRWHEAYKHNYQDYDYNTLVSVRTWNERRGILTANETTDYFFGFSNTHDAAAILEIPPGLFVGMINSMWQESPSDVGIFGPNAGAGGNHVIVGPATPPQGIPEPADGFRVHHVNTDRVFYVLRAIGTPDG